MTSLRATGMFQATALKAAAAVPERDGKVTPGGGKNLPAGLPVDGNRGLEPVARELERMSRTIGRAPRFEVDLDGGQAVIQVLDRDTGENIRRIPREKLSPFLAANGALYFRLFDELV